MMRKKKEILKNWIKVMHLYKETSANGHNQGDEYKSYNLVIVIIAFYINNISKNT